MNIAEIAFRGLTVSLLTLAFLIGACQTSKQTPSDAFMDLAQQLSLSIPRGAKVAIRPFLANEVPLPLKNAQGYNVRLDTAFDQVKGNRSNKC